MEEFTYFLKGKTSKEIDTFCRKNLNRLLNDYVYYTKIFGCRHLVRDHKCNKPIWVHHSHVFQNVTPPLWLTRYWVNRLKKPKVGRPLYTKSEYSRYDDYPDFNDPTVKTIKKEDCDWWFNVERNGRVTVTDWNLKIIYLT